MSGVNHLDRWQSLTPHHNELMRFETWRSRQSPSRSWLTGHILSLVGEGNSPPLKGRRCPCSGASSLLTSSQVPGLVSRQSSKGPTKGNLKVSPYHHPLRNKACARKYSQSSREWQIQTRQPPRHVGSLVQRSVHSSPGGAGKKKRSVRGARKKKKM